MTGYAALLDRHRHLVLLGSLAILLGGSLLARRLPVRTELSYLLPPDAPSVRDLRAIEQRSQVFGNVVIGVVSDDPERRLEAAGRLHRKLAALPPDLVAAIVVDDAPLRAFAWEHRFLYAPLEDLVAAREAIERKKLSANPLYIDLESGLEEGEEALRERLRQAEEARDRPKPLVAKDGRTQLLTVAASFAPQDLERCRRLRAGVDRAVAETRAEIGGGVELGAAGDVLTAAIEHDAILSGMVVAVAATCLIVGLGLLLYYRSASAIFALLYALAVGALATFGLTRLTIGHLNGATAFLASIVIGNGINFPLILLARYLEERRRGQVGQAAVAAAMALTVRGTLCAALAAGIAYASLVVTSFRGFRDFGVIGGVGMVACWLAAYTVLPALLLLLERLGRIRLRGSEPALGRFLARLMPRRAGAVLLVAVPLSVAAAIATFRYLRSDPFEYDFRALGSSDAASRENRRWMDRLDAAFGRGIAGSVVVAADSRADAARVAELLAQAVDGSGRAVFAQVGTIDELLPRDQDRKRDVLGELRALLDDETLALLDEDDRADPARFRPPAELRALGPDDLPAVLARRYTERDGTRGRLVFASPGPAIDPSDGRDLIRMAALTRALPLPEGARVAGTPFVWADVIVAIQRDGARATFAALAGVILFTALVIGVRRYGLSTLGAAACGTVGMLAACSLAGVKINFLDFVAFPITLGIAVDYTANIAARARLEGPGSARRVLETTGGAVVLCSFTTMVGYGSLLLSPNAGIRSFGLTAIIGEVTCILAAVLLAPALLEVSS